MTDLRPILAQLEATDCAECRLEILYRLVRLILAEIVKMERMR